MLCIRLICLKKTTHLKLGAYRETMGAGPSLQDVCGLWLMASSHVVQSGPMWHMVASCSWLTGHKTVMFKFAAWLPVLRFMLCIP